MLFKPRGWSWVDPTKEVAAYKEAIKAGLTTVTDVIAATGGGMDIEDVVKTRKRELAMFEDAGIDVDTTVVPAGQLSAGLAPAAAEPAADTQDQNNDPQASADGAAPPARVLQMKRG